MEKKREFHAGRFGGCGFFGAASVLPLKVTFSAKGLTVLLATLFLGSAAWAAESQEHKDEDFTSPRELWVELHDGTGLDSTSVTGLRSEVESLYATAGIQIRWLTESLLEAKPYLARVYIMQKLPRSFDRRLWLFRRQRPMATAFGKSGEVSSPVIFVSRAAVAKNASGGAAVEPRSEELAKALGRVVAHELGHLFIGARHTRRGILKASFGQSELIGSASALFFTSDQIAKLQSRIDEQMYRAIKHPPR